MISIAFPTGPLARLPDAVIAAPPVQRSRPREGVASHYRALFLSDLHLGATACRADMLLEFLTSVSADRLYLVGDVFDFCRYRAPHWTSVHDRVLTAIERLGISGTEVTRLPGNHDRTQAQGPGSALKIGPDAVIHHGLMGERYLVLHGDCCESRLGRSTAMARMGSYIDWRAQVLDDALRRRGNRALAGRAIRWGDALISRNDTIKARLMRLAADGGYDGIICGHLHQPILLHEGGTTYANCGDWITSMTAVAEEHCGALSLIDWKSRTVSRLSVARMAEIA